MKGLGYIALAILCFFAAVGMQCVAMHIISWMV